MCLQWLHSSFKCNGNSLSSKSLNPWSTLRNLIPVVSLSGAAVQNTSRRSFILQRQFCCPELPGWPLLCGGVVFSWKDIQYRSSPTSRDMCLLCCYICCLEQTPPRIWADPALLIFCRAVKSHFFPVHWTRIVIARRVSICYIQPQPCVWVCLVISVF